MNLLNSVIKLAQDNPEYKSILMPIIKAATTNNVIDESAEVADPSKIQGSKILEDASVGPKVEIEGSTIQDMVTIDYAKVTDSILLGYTIIYEAKYPKSKITTIQKSKIKGGVGSKISGGAIISNSTLALAEGAVIFGGNWIGCRLAIPKHPDKDYGQWKDAEDVKAYLADPYEWNRNKNRDTGLSGGYD